MALGDSGGGFTPLPSLDLANIGIANSPNPGGGSTFGTLPTIDNTSASSAHGIQVASNDPTSGYTSAAAPARQLQIADNSIPQAANISTTNPASILPTPGPPPGTNNSLIVKPGTPGGSSLSAIGQNAIKNFLDQSKDLPALNNQVTITNQRFGTAIDALVSSSAQSQEVIQDAYHKINVGQFVPQKIAKILGLFGLPDYDVEYQKTRIQAQAADLQSKSMQANALGTAAQAAASMAGVAREAQTAAVGTAATLARDAREQALLGIQEQQARMQRAQFLAEGIPDEQLSAAIAHPEIYQRQNKDISVGMLQGIQQARQAKATALATAKLINTHQGYENTVAQAQALDTQRNEYVKNLSYQDFTTQQAEAKDKGYATVPFADGGTLKIPNTFYDTIANARNTLAIEQAKAAVDVNVAAASNPAAVRQLGDQWGRMVNDPSVAATTSTDEFRKTATDINTANVLTSQKDPGSQLAAAKLLETTTANAQAIVKTALDALPPDQRAGAAAHYKNGSIPSTDMATNFVASSMRQSDSPLADGDLFYHADKSIRDAIGSARQAAEYPNLALFGGTAGGGSKTMAEAGGAAALASIAKGTPSDQNLFSNIWNQVYKNTNGETEPNPQTGKPVTIGEHAKSVAIQQEQQVYAFNSIMDLAHKGVGNFNELVSGGDIDPKFKTPEGGLNVKGIFRYLADRDTELASSNVRQLRGKLNDPAWKQTFEKFDAAQHNLPIHSAYRQLFFNGNVSGVAATPLVRELDQIERTLPAVKADEAQNASNVAAMANPYAGGAGMYGTAIPNFEDAVAAAKGLYSISPTLRTRNNGPIGTNPNLPLSPGGLRRMEEYGRGGITPYPTNRPPGIPAGAIWNGSAWVWYPNQSGGGR